MQSAFDADALHKLIYNVSAYENEPDEELKAFLRFISSGKPSDSFTDKINALILQAKQAEANKTEYMSMNLHDYDMMEIGKEEGALEKALESAKRMLIKGYSVEEIADITSLDSETVLSLKAEMQAAVMQK